MGANSHVKISVTCSITGNVVVWLLLIVSMILSPIRPMTPWNDRAVNTRNFRFHSSSYLNFTPQANTCSRDHTILQAPLTTSRGRSVIIRVSAVCWSNMFSVSNGQTKEWEWRCFLVISDVISLHLQQTHPFLFNNRSPNVSFKKREIHFSTSQNKCLYCSYKFIYYWTLSK